MPSGVRGFQEACAGDSQTGITEGPEQVLRMVGGTGETGRVRSY